MKLNSRAKRLFVDFPLLDGHQGKSTEYQYHYLSHVLRIKEGEEILLFNGKDGEWLAKISYKPKKTINFDIIHQTRVQTQPFDFQYIFSPIKTKRLDYMIQKSVEMGVSVITPVIMRYTQNKISDMNRIRTYAISAAEQCNIITIPSIHPPVALDAILDNWDKNRHVIFADETYCQKNSLKIIQEIPNTSSIAIIVGPEGGFHPDEIEKLRSLPFVTPISLGPRILRSDTAAVAAMALVQSICGDWYEAYK
ncbi:MAG: 16S rRNA (uracil(1498)-N(3))-methyltransferase [Candidatus Liberibacter europaeus]|uniref:Ribosomal RNA small subunit methyltransferase E n=1 Tax=Candidatus Liberibacter europaeus TaxID=744859 RepID=A0A2T4VX90_9HYPH|nr:16S rRNA (uracil(1498)-N(3))-methyltransferase [Candidatus Liberibacter europaeus]PTL86399.1 MAG: 16S rRNA (uracil(1498)-N(3))-methyltransferase [Candidatus Liberibacter europaeus]